VAIERCFVSSERAEELVLRAFAALELSNEVAELADEAILEERGYLVTGGEGFAEPYYTAVGEFAARVGELELLFDDAPERLADVRQLTEVFQRWQREVAVPAIAARRRNEVDTGAALVASAGRKLSNEINALATRLTKAQGTAVRERLFESSRVRTNAARWAIVVVVLTMLLTVGAGVYFSLQLRRRLGELELTAEALAHGELDRRAATDSNDEVGRLAQSFNLMVDQVQSRAREAAGQRKLSELLQACGNVQEAFEVTERVVPSLLPGSRVVIHILNASRSALEVATQFGGESAQVSTEPAAPSDCWAFRRGAEHRGGVREAVPTCRHAGADADSYLCIPLLAHGENLGVLTLAPSPDEMLTARAERLAEQIGLAIANLQLRESLRNQAVRDGLTGLYNRRYFDEAAERELSRAQRHERPLVFMVLDVDHFKRFNDTHGHDAGDLLLREVGQLLRSSVRQSDVACRYGGEEFVLILPESPLEEARRRADQIRLAFHQLGLPYQGKSLGTISVSIGVAAYPDHGNDRVTLLRNADAALYRAKHEGRDRVMLATITPAA
jgi:diguanylate cyclase (GGDEF)-like protein